MKIKSALRVANEVVRVHSKRDRCNVLSMYRLQKLLYLAYGWFHALRGGDLFDDRIEAWEKGPVVPSVYYAFMHQYTGKEGSRTPIKEPVAYGDEVGEPLAQKAREFIRKGAVDPYLEASTEDLIKLTHGTAYSPYHRVRKDGELFTEIPKSMIKGYFRELQEEMARMESVSRGKV